MHAMSNKEFNHLTDTVKTLTLLGNYRHQKETEPHQISPSTSVVKFNTIKYTYTRYFHVLLRITTVFFFYSATTLKSHKYNTGKIHLSVWDLIK